MTTASNKRIVAVALNPAIDRVLEVPGLTLGAHQVARLLARYPGGKAVNVAKGLSRLGVGCVLTGLVGEGEFDSYARDLERFAVPMEMLPVAGQTRENITLVDPVARTETHLRDRGFQVTRNELGGLREKLRRLANPETIFAFSGSLPPGMAPADLVDLLKICREAGSLVAVDASGPALPAAVEAGLWLIKPNRQELEELLGGRVEDRKQLLAAGRNLARRIEVVLVSCGAEGAYLFAGEAAWHGSCPIPAERVVSTVGCGDALLAGFLAGLHQGLGYAGALKLAVAAAGAAVLSLSALFEREPVDGLLGQATTDNVTI